MMYVRFALSLLNVGDLLLERGIDIRHETVRHWRSRFDVAAFGSFVAEVPPPLAIGTVTLADGTHVKGFLAEPRAIIGAKDITAFGGWREFIDA